jgi:hypothetical protein
MKPSEISASACQQPSVAAIPSPFAQNMNEALRVLRRAERWPETLKLPRIIGVHCDLRVGHVPSVFKSELIQTSLPALFLVKTGALILTSTRRPITVSAGDGAIVAPGYFYLTELPYAGTMEYWRIFFSPRSIISSV